MLKELLLCLFGHTSPLLNTEKGVNILSKYLQPKEKECIQGILTVASQYRDVNNFISTYKAITRSKTEKPAANSTEYGVGLQPGLYLEALCIGLNNASDDYLQMILKVEDGINKEVEIHLKLLLMLRLVEEQAESLSLLNEIIQAVQRNNLHGCQILELLYQTLKGTTHQKHGMILKIIRAVNTQFYRDLKFWILFGDVKDRFKEFFITAVINENQTNFHVDEMLLPSFMVSCVCNVLLTGKTIHTLLNDPRKSLFENKNDDYFEWNSSVRNCRDALEKLEDVFNPELFESIISPLALSAKEKLWKLVVKDGNLLMHIQIIREYLLMSRGEFYQEFIQLGSSVLQNQTTNISVLALNKLFEKAWYNINYSGDGPPEGLTFYYVTDPNKPETVKNAIRLKYNTPWPVQILFQDDNVMEKYGFLFSFLLRIKTVQSNLNNLWLCHMKYSKKICLDKNLYKLRNKCSFLLDNLQYYLQVDVIETNYTIMINAIKNSTNYQIVLDAHKQFINSIVKESFVCAEPQVSVEDKTGNLVHLELIRLITFIELFCKTANHWHNVMKSDEKNNLQLNKVQIEEIDGLNAKLNDFLYRLLTLLDALPSQYSGKQLQRLITRLHLTAWLCLSPFADISNKISKMLVNDSLDQ